MRPRTDGFRHSLLVKADQQIPNRPEIHAFSSYSVLKTINCRNDLQTSALLRAMDK